MTQVTALLADDPSWERLAQGLVVLCVLWWTWCCYAWLGNAVRADRGRLRVVLLAVMALVFVIALTVRETYDDLPGGLSGAVVFVICYALVRFLHLAAYWVSDPTDRGLHAVLLRAAVTLLPSIAVFLVGAVVGGRAQVWLWAGAFVLDAVGIYVNGGKGWSVRSPHHWGERHALIVIVALGESIVAIGVGAETAGISLPVIVGAMLGLAVSASLWWLYFDGPQQDGEHALEHREGDDRTRLARDAYTYLHFPLIAGVVVLALGLKKVLEYTADSEHHQLTDALHGVPAYALSGGAGLFVLGLVAFRLRTTGRVRWPGVVVGAALLVAGPVVERLPALVALALVTALVGALTVGAHRRSAAPVA
jgi:low temperature requirement protein LtrA